VHSTCRGSSTNAKEFLVANLRNEFTIATLLIHTD
jgi:hypothetical protein